MNADGETPASGLRISDADRQAAVELLKNASAEGRITLAEYDERVTAAYAAKYYGDLEPLLADLPRAAGGAGPSVSPVAVPVAGAAVAAGPTVAAESEAARIGETSTIAIMSGHDRKGRWRPAPVTTAVAVMGGCSIDLREAILPAGGLRINAIAVMGGMEITVPEGMDVVLTGFSFMGGRSVKLADAPRRTDLPTVHIHAIAIMGGFDIRSKPPRQLEGQPRKELR
jgi:Domain of unknown function (DUF1707)/Cell wall-active antibiotics response 4TMS YvqF